MTDRITKDISALGSLFQAVYTAHLSLVVSLQEMGTLPKGIHGPALRAIGEDWPDAGAKRWLADLADAVDAEFPSAEPSARLRAVVDCGRNEDDD